jgi:hypothetical protein
MSEIKPSHLFIGLIIVIILVAIFWGCKESFSNTRVQKTYKPFKAPASRTILRKPRATRRATRRPKSRKAERFTQKKKMVFKAPMSLTKLKKSLVAQAVSDKEADLMVGTKKSIQEIFEVLEKVDQLRTYYKGNALSFPSFFHVDEKFPGSLPRPLFQGQCGSCWGFACCTALASRFYIESCGISGCLNYPQINFGSLNNVYNNINEIYKFRKLYLTDVFKYIDTNRNRQITRDEWIDVIMKYFDLFNGLGTPLMEKHYIVQVLTYILDFQSLGSVDLTNLEEVFARSSEVFYVWKTFTVSSVINDSLLIEAVKDSDTIDLDALEERWKSEPINLSAEKIVACCIRCIEVDFEDKMNDEPQALQCLGGTLDDGWSLLRETGTPTALCIGYNMDSYVEGSETPSCKTVQGPNYSFCSGYSILHKETNLNDVLYDFENSDINPLAIPHNEKNLPWIDPQLFRFRSKSVYQIKNDMKGIQREIIERGPVTTGFYIYPDFQYDFGTEGMGGQKFEGGNPLGSTKDSLIYMWSGKGEPIGGHAVTVVGWGTYIWETDQIGCVCNKLPDGKLDCTCSNDRGMRKIKIPYWICLNSWGVNWGTSGFASLDDRTKEPTDMSMGGYFWMVRGINNCEMEDNFVGGQPDIDNISYPGVVDKYGWGLPPPDKDEVTFVKQIDHVNTGPNNEFVFNRSKEGGGTFVDKEEKIVKRKGPDGTVVEEVVNEWVIQSMDPPPSPYVLFWNDLRPIYCLGLTNEKMDSLTNDDIIIVDKVTADLMADVDAIQRNPLLVVNDEQMQMLYIVDEEHFTGIKVYRGVNNSNLTSHPPNSIIKVVPFKTLTPTILEKILYACPPEEIQYIDILDNDIVE